MREIKNDTEQWIMKRKLQLHQEKNVIVGDGAGVTKNIEANAVVGGVQSEGGCLEMKYHINKNKEIITIKQNTVSQIKTEYKNLYQQ